MTSRGGHPFDNDETRERLERLANVSVPVQIYPSTIKSSLYDLYRFSKEPSHTCHALEPLTACKVLRAIRAQPAHLRYSPIILGREVKKDGRTYSSHRSRAWLR